MTKSNFREKQDIKRQLKELKREFRSLATGIFTAYDFSYIGAFVRERDVGIVLGGDGLEKFEVGAFLENPEIILPFFDRLLEDPSHYAQSVTLGWSNIAVDYSNKVSHPGRKSEHIIRSKLVPFSPATSTPRSVLGTQSKYVYSPRFADEVFPLGALR